ncbi:TPA: LOW QUALITY PROTEIN: hypothetical protein N0F65_003204, partial [Lagenidium giganteum]
VYLRMHMQITNWFQRVTSVKHRHALEVATFVVVAHLFVLLAWMHVSFVSPKDHGACLQPYMPAANASDALQVLRIQVNAVLPSCAWLLWRLTRGGIARSYRTRWKTSASIMISRIAHGSDLPIFNGGLTWVHGHKTSFVYAEHQGLLSLFEHGDNASTAEILRTVYVPHSSSCFDLVFVHRFPLWEVFLTYVLGYDTILMNHLSKLYGRRGFFYRESMKVVRDMGYGVFSPLDSRSSWLMFIALKFKMLHTILFLFFIMTALVAFVLMETQKRMITFTGLFQNRTQLQIPFSNLVLAYFAQSLMFVPVLVGMLFFLFELYKDHFLAFCMMSLIWVGESFSIISVRTRTSQLFFPPLFFCAFTFFHVYHFSFPFGFSYVALCCIGMLLAQVMLFFWNCVEIPALHRGEISVQTPRERHVFWGQVSQPAG